jgi:hypothetical protein
MQEHRLKHYLNNIHSRPGSTSNVEEVHSDIKITELWHTETKSVVGHAMGYLGAFLLCQLFPWYPC